MEPHQFKLGDVVILKSGSVVPMTVDELCKGGEISVTWMTPKGEIQGRVFPAELLKLYENDDKPKGVTFRIQ